VTIIWAATNGYLDDVETAKIRDFEIGLYRFLESTDPDLLPAIAKEKAISDELGAKLKKAVLAFRNEGGYGADQEPAVESAPAAAAEVPAAPDEEADADFAGEAPPKPPAKPGAKPRGKRKPPAGKAAAGRKKGSGA
jgi:hypothetical protein